MSTPTPNFFLVGAAKAGTTSLHHYLGQHPSIYVSPIKEPHYFADEVRPDNFCAEMRSKIAAREPALREYLRGPVRESFSGGPVCNWDDYLRLFRCAGDRRVIGEASPCYLWSPTAPRNIANRFPNAKILMILRDPAERAFAQYAHMLMFANSPISFREHTETAPDLSQRHMQAQVPRSWVVNRLLKQTGAWGAANAFPAPLKPFARHVMFRSRRSMLLAPEDRKFLIDFYRDDIRQVETLTGRDLSCWLE